MRRRLTFQELIILLFVGSLVPLMVSVGLVVYRLQQTYLITASQKNLVEFVQGGIKRYANKSELTTLAVNLGANLRVLGADLFIQDANGLPVAPSLGTGSWLDASENQAIRAQRSASMRLIGSGASARLVYLVAILDDQDNVLGSVEASLPMAGINDQLAALRRWLVWIIALASFLAVLLALSLSGALIRPLKSLLASVTYVRLGHLETRAKIPRVYELAQLALAYNQMLDRISADLEAQTRLADTMRQFVADASHELRSPLSVFGSSVDMLDKTFRHDDPRQFQEILAILRNEVGGMTRLVENLLLLSRLDQPPETAALTLHPEVINPLPFLEDICERSRLVAKGQQIELIWPAETIAPIRADREMLRRALNNVIENAIACTPAGSKITLSLANEDGYCSFIVADQGIGIAKDQLEKIFDRFYRSDESRNRRIPGTGLGLAIVAAIMRVHGGQVKVESEPGQGTRFQLLFKQLPEAE
ncbi:MAG: sensor histidine kinase [Anaerolineae bacterium]